MKAGPENWQDLSEERESLGGSNVTEGDFVMVNEGDSGQDGTSRDIGDLGLIRTSRDTGNLELGRNSGEARFWGINPNLIPSAMGVWAWLHSMPSNSISMPTGTHSVSGSGTWSDW